LALTDYITEKLGQEKVLLVGHSFGASIWAKGKEGKSARTPTFPLFTLLFALKRTGLENDPLSSD
jgi:hypothetical protein